MEIFPEEITWTLERNVVSNRIRSDAQRRWQQRRQILHRPFFTFKLNSENLSRDQSETLNDFFVVHEFADGDDADAFLLKDPDDHERTGQNIGVGDGSEDQFSTIATYEFGNKSKDVVQGWIIQDSDTLYLDGTETTNYVLNNESGLITFDTAPADGVQITADFQFRRKCIFNEDSLTSNAEDPLNRDFSYEIVEVP